VAKKVKLTRKQIKAPDEFVTTTTRFVEYCVEHARVIIFSLLGFVAAVLIAAVSFYVMQSHKQKSVDLLSMAEEIYRKPVVVDPKAVEASVPHFQSVQEKYPKAIESFRQVIDQYPNSHSALMARLYIGNTYYDMTKYADAAQAFEEFVGDKYFKDDAHKSTIYWMGMLGLGYSYESQGEKDKALAAFEKIADPTNKNGFQGEALTSIARIKTRAKDFQGAAKALKDYLDANPDASDRYQIESQLRQLESSTGEAAAKQG